MRQHAVDQELSKNCLCLEAGTKSCHDSLDTRPCHDNHVCAGGCRSFYCLSQEMSFTLQSGQTLFLAAQRDIQSTQKTCMQLFKTAFSVSLAISVRPTVTDTIQKKG